MLISLCQRPWHRIFLAIQRSVSYIYLPGTIYFLLYFQSTWNDSFPLWWFPYAVSKERGMAYSVSVRPHSETIKCHLTGRNPKDCRGPSNDIEIWVSKGIAQKTAAIPSTSQKLFFKKFKNHKGDTSDFSKPLGVPSLWSNLYLQFYHWK